MQAFCVLGWADYVDSAAQPAQMPSFVSGSKSRNHWDIV